MIRNQKLIKELIKRDYSINLDELEKIDFILTEFQVNSLEDISPISSYLSWYTDKCKKQGHRWWTDERSLDVLYRYLKEFKDIEGRELLPTDKDIYYLTEVMVDFKRNANKDWLSIVNKEYEEKYEHYNW